MSLDSLREKLTEQFATLPERLGGHIELTMTALAIGIVISIPLGIFVAKRPKLESIVLGIASVIQTIPSLALLALMVFLFSSIGWVPACVALILYSVLPMLRSTVTGIQGVDEAYIEAARGIGMDQRQMLWQVEFPLALPSIVAGLRTATVWVVGAATLAQPVGATSLGNYIFVGLQTMNFGAMVFGCVLSATLAMVLDTLLRRLETAVGNRNHSSARKIALTFGLIALSPLLMNLISTSTSPFAATAATDTKTSSSVEPFVIGSKAFTEQYILLKAMCERLDEQGVPYEARDGMGSGMVFSAMVNGKIDCYVDYTGTVWTNYMKRPESSSPAEMLVDVSTFLKAEKKIVCLGTLGFRNDYVFAMRREHAGQLGIETLDDLVPHARELVAAGDIEFFARPEWSTVQQMYGLTFKQNVSMDPALMYGAVANKEADIAIAFRTDARIDGYDLQVIEDTRYAMPPYDAVILVSPRMARNRKAMNALRPMVNRISTERMRRVNGLVDVEGQSPSNAAKQLFD